MQETDESITPEEPYPEYVYPNYKMELRDRKVSFYPSSEAGTLRYQRIPMCGHKFVPQREPRHRNCHSCWFTFFQVHGEFTQSVEKVYAELGEDALKKIRGPKFVHKFLMFMSTIAAYQQAMLAAKENNVSTGRIEGSDGEAVNLNNQTEGN